MQQTENLAPHVQEITRALQNRMEPEAVEDELRRYLEYGVPLAQAKRDIVRMHGGTLQAGEKKIANLLAEDRGVELTAKILTVNPKEITVKGQPKTIWYGFVADETGKVPYTAWKDFDLQRGRVYHVKNAYAKKGFRDPVDLQLGDYTQMEITDLDLDVKDDFSGGAGPASGGEPGSRVAAERTVRDLRDGMSSVTVTGRVLWTERKPFGGDKTLLAGEIADATGRVPFSAWEPDKLPPEFADNAVVRVKNAYVRAFRGVPNLNFGQYATVETLPDGAAPGKEELMEAKPFTLAELESAGGGAGIRVEGVVLEVKKGSGLIFRCPQEGCNRVLQKSECRVHGKQKGVADLRVKAVLDDGRGVATFFAGRDVTERVLGKTLAECQEMAREAMTVDVIQDEITAQLTARRVVVEGSATSDEYGLTLNADALRFAEARDVEAEAEKLLGQVVEILQEVGQ